MSTAWAVVIPLADSVVTRDPDDTALAIASAAVIASSYLCNHAQGSQSHALVTRPAQSGA
eukprot:4421070-Pyramimonas_sp.AAC.1